MNSLLARLHATQAAAKAKQEEVTTEPEVIEATAEVVADEPKKLTPLERIKANKLAREEAATETVTEKPKLTTPKLVKQVKEVTEQIVANETNQLAAIEEAQLANLEFSDDLRKIEGLDADRLIDNITGVWDALENSTGGIKNYLREILINIRQYPEISYILTDEQVGLISSGMLKQAGIEISVSAVKKKKPAKAATTISIDSISLL